MVVSVRSNSRFCHSHCLLVAVFIAILALHHWTHTSQPDAMTRTEHWTEDEQPQFIRQQQFVIIAGYPTTAALSLPAISCPPIDYSVRFPSHHWMQGNQVLCQTAAAVAAVTASICPLPPFTQWQCSLAIQSTDASIRIHNQGNSRLIYVTTTAAIWSTHSLLSSFFVFVCNIAHWCWILQAHIRMAITRRCYWLLR